MGAYVTLYRPVKTKYIPGEIDTMSNVEYNKYLKIICNDKLPNPTPLTDGYFKDHMKHKHFDLIAYHTNGKRNKYAIKKINYFLTNYNDYLIDTFTYLSNDTKQHLSNINGRYFIPVNPIFEYNIIGTHKFYNLSHTIRYAFTKNDAKNLIKQYVKKNCYNTKTIDEIIFNIESNWEDNMFLVLAW